MVNTIKHLSYLLSSSEQELTRIIGNIDRYYSDPQKPKTKYGQEQRDDKGNIKYRELCVSIYPLKGIQIKINALLQQIELPAYAYGSIKGKSNLLNVRQHISGKYFLRSILKIFFQTLPITRYLKCFEKMDFHPQLHDY